MLAIAFARARNHDGENSSPRSSATSASRFSRSRPTLATALSLPSERKITEACFGFQITGHTRVIAAAAMTDVVDVQIEMIAPEEWRES